MHVCTDVKCKIIWKMAELITALTNWSIVKQTQIKSSLITTSVVCPCSAIPLDYNSFIRGRHTPASTDYNNSAYMSFPAILVAPFPIWSTHYATAGLHKSFSAKLYSHRKHSLQIVLPIFNCTAFRRTANRTCCFLRNRRDNLDFAGSGCHSFQFPYSDLRPRPEVKIL